MSIWWKLGGAAVALIAAYFLITMYGGARYRAGKADERTAWQGEAVKAERAKLDAFRAGLAQQQAAETVYRETVRTLPPITHTIVERTTEYAATPDGAAQCLPAFRVQLLAGTRAALFPAAPAASPGGGHAALPPG